MANDTRQVEQRKAATRTAIVLGLVALAFYVAFFITRF